MSGNPLVNIVTAPWWIARNFTKTTITTALDAIGNDNVLDIAQNAFMKGTQHAILTFVSVVTKTILGASLGYLGPIHVIWNKLLENPATKQLLEDLRTTWWVPAYFLIDILEPMKRFVPAESPDGTPMEGAEVWNNYNELDLDQAMNRHAVLSQIQRFLKSIIEIFRLNDQNEQDFRMNTTLDSDTHETAWDMSALKRNDDPVQQPETWLFVNGIAGEFYWNRLAVNKLRDFFFDQDKGESNEDANNRRTQIRGIYNRSDGILWDLVECGGERQPEVAPTLIYRTESSKAAQRQLATELRNALADSKTSNKDIIMIAHSQGCLLLRLALDEVWNGSNTEVHDLMRTHLRVYTFGNPAYDWDCHAFAATTEHFANELDFVAVLGVLRQYKTDARGTAPDSDLFFCSECRKGNEKHLDMQKQLIFVNNKHQKGHLFGSQYSLQEVDYDCVNNQGSRSTLLRRAKKGTRQG
ncbi:hypothetical protein Q7P37_006431 [Cladosporium fusiforme]